MIVDEYNAEYIFIAIYEMYSVEYTSVSSSGVWIFIEGIMLSYDNFKLSFQL